MAQDNTAQFAKASGSSLDTEMAESRLQRRVDGLRPPEGFTNADEYKRRWLEVARENLADKFLLEKVQNGKHFGTGAALSHIDAMANDYTAIKHNTGVMENIVNPTGKTGTARMSSDTRQALRQLEGTSESLKEAARTGAEFSVEGSKSLIRTANKLGLSADDVITFHELSQGQKLPDGMAKPMREAQQQLIAEAAPAPAAAPKSQEPTSRTQTALKTPDPVAP